MIYAAPNKSGQRRVLAILRGDESRVLVPSDEIAPIMKQAIVAVEDKRFYEHNGVDVRGIVRALWQDIRSQAVVEGGSTITQQYVKNAYSRNEQTIARKVREAALAWQLDAALVEGPDPDRLPQHDLLRERRLRDPAGGADLLRRQERGRADAARGGAPRRDPRQPLALRPGAASCGRDASGAPTCWSSSYDQGRITDAELRAADATPLPEARGRPPPRARAGPLRTSSTTSPTSSWRSTAASACSAAASR